MLQGPLVYICFIFKTQLLTQDVLIYNRVSFLHKELFTRIMTVNDDVAMFSIKLCWHKYYSHWGTGKMSKGKIQK